MSKVSTSNAFDTACFPGPPEADVALHLTLFTLAGVAMRRLHTSAAVVLL